MEAAIFAFIVKTLIGCAEKDLWNNRHEINAYLHRKRADRECVIASHSKSPIHRVTLQEVIQKKRASRKK